MNIYNSHIDILYIICIYIKKNRIFNLKILVFDYFNYSVKNNYRFRRYNKI